MVKKDRLFKIYWTNRCETIVAGPTIVEALRREGYLDSDIKLIKDWKVYDENLGIYQ